MECMFTLTAPSGFKATVKAYTPRQLEDALHAHGYTLIPPAAARRAFDVGVGNTVESFSVKIRRLS